MAPDKSMIFISYSRNDAEFALRLGNDLKAKGVNVWLDQLDIKPGTIWDTEVEEALEKSEKFLIILSPESVASVNVKDELSFALDEHKEIIPVLMKGCKIPFRIKRRQYIDFTLDYEDGLGKLLKAFSIQQQKTTPSESGKTTIVSEEAIEHGISKNLIFRTGEKKTQKRKKILIISSIISISIIVVLIWQPWKKKTIVIPEFGYFIDQRDSVKYKTVKIGIQTWMAENLKATKYNDGNAIPLVTEATDWLELKTAGYCWYNNDEAANKNTYGALYNWYAVNTAKLCPTGWHVPTDDEWKQLEMNLGMSRKEANGDEFRGTDEGNKLKNTTGWISGGNGTDKVGFSALPGGYRDDGDFGSLGYTGYWWSATEIIGSKFAWGRYLGYDNDKVGRHYYDKEYGFSVRCVRD